MDKPKMIAFRPNEKDQEKIDILMDTLQSKSPFKEINKTDVIRFAVEQLHNSYSIFFIDDDHRRNFETLREKWSYQKTNVEYQAPIYIMAIPMLFEKLEKHMDSFETPIDWIWRVEWKENHKDHDDLTEEEIKEAEEIVIPYDLTGSMVRLGRMALHFWNGYDKAHFLHCVDSLDENNVKALFTAIDIRMGKYDLKRTFN